MDMSLSRLQEMVKDREAWCPLGCKELNTAEQLNNEGEAAVVPDPGSLSLICTVTPMQTPVYMGSPTNTYTICLNILSFLASF